MNSYNMKIEKVSLKTIRTAFYRYNNIQRLCVTSPKKRIPKFRLFSSKPSFFHPLTSDPSFDRDNKRSSTSIHLFHFRLSVSSQGNDRQINIWRLFPSPSFHIARLTADAGRGMSLQATQRRKPKENGLKRLDRQGIDGHK